MRRGGWQVERAHGPAGRFHARPMPEPPARRVWLLQVSRPAVVLGSTQPEAHVDPAAAAGAGVEVVRRRSGGGAVLLVPGEVVWADVFVPRRDPLWDDDVGRATWWLGEAWAEAVAALGVAGAEVHRGPLWRGGWSARACFGGVGAGEVLVAGRKLVGISQRRARDQARFQCAALVRWRPDELAAVVGGGAPGDEPPPASALGDLAVGLADLVAPPPSVAAVESALVSALSSR